MRTTTLPIALLALLLAGPDARAAHLAETVHPTTVAGLPEPVRALIERDFGEMADVGGPFSEWCVRRPGSFGARLIWAEVRPEVVQVRFETGGIAGAQIRQKEFRKTDDSWSEVRQPGAPERIVWMGRPRSFSLATDHVLPPLGKPASQ